MTELVRIGRVEVVRLPGHRAHLVGPSNEVAQLLDRIRRAGQLVAASDPVPDGRPGVYAVTVRLLEPERQQATPAPAARFWTRQRLVVASSIGLAVLVACAGIGYLLLSWVMAHLAFVLAGLLVTALVCGVTGHKVCKTAVTVTVTHRH